MKQFDFLEALNGLPEEYAKELTEWQQNRTPLPDAQEKRQATEPCVQEETVTVKKHNDISVKWLRPVTAVIFSGIAACLVLGLYFGIKAHNSANSQPQTTPAAEIAEQNADQEKEVLSEQAEPNDYVVWDPKLKLYVLSGKEIPEKTARDLFFPLIPYQGDIPEELEAAFLEYRSGNAEYQREYANLFPDPQFISYYPPAPGADRILAEKALPYLSTCFEMAVTDGTYHDEAQIVIEKVLNEGREHYGRRGAWYRYLKFRMSEDAAQAVAQCGDNLTKEEAEKLQETWGYLIAPALKSAGKLELLTFNPDSLCTDPEQLASLAAEFGKGYAADTPDRISLYVTTTKTTADVTATETTRTTAASTATLPAVTVPQNAPDAGLSFSTAVLAPENRWVPCKEEWVENAAETEAKWRSLIGGFTAEEVTDWQTQFDFCGGGFMLRITDGDTAVIYELFGNGLYKRITEDEAGTHTAYLRDSSGNEIKLVWEIQAQFTSHNYQWSNFANAFQVTE